MCYSSFFVCESDSETRFFFGFQVSGLGMVPEPDTRTFKTWLYPKPEPENPNFSGFKFWLDVIFVIVILIHDQYPHLSKLFLKTSINSSSAIIERFFSICGIINTQRNQNMEFELFEILAIHSSNFKILEKIKIKKNRVE